MTVKVVRLLYTQVRLRELLYLVAQQLLKNVVCCGNNFKMCIVFNFFHVVILLLNGHPYSLFYFSAQLLAWSVWTS